MALKPNQLKAVELLAQGKLKKEVAEGVGVTAQTISLWCKDPEFEAVVNQVKWDALHCARDGLQNLSLEAVDAIRYILKESSNDNARLKAALAIFDLIGMTDFNSGRWGWGIGGTTKEELEREHVLDGMPSIAEVLRGLGEN